MSLTGEEQTTVSRMVDDRLPKRAAELREQGRRRRGTQMLRWEDRVKRHVSKVLEEEDWKTKTKEGWKRQSDEEVTSHTYQHIRTDKDSYKYSFYPRTIIQWNILPIHVHEAVTVDAFKALVPVTVLAPIYHV